MTIESTEGVRDSEASTFVARGNRTFAPASVTLDDSSMGSAPAVTVSKASQPAVDSSAGASAAGDTPAKPAKGKRVVYMDLLNIFACLAVVFLHCNNTVHIYAPGKNWAFSLVIEVAFYWAVPIFLMISGANLMRYRDRYDTKTFFEKRLAKTFIPFVIWSAILYVLRFDIESYSPSFGLSDFTALSSSQTASRACTGSSSRCSLCILPCPCYRCWPIIGGCWRISPVRASC